MPSSTDPSPSSSSSSSSAAAILTSDAPLPDIAARLKLPLPDLIKLLQSPDAQSLIESIIRIDTQRADHREQRSRLTALSTLESVCTDPASGPVEKRRAAAAILAKSRGDHPPRPDRKPDRQGGRPSSPNSPRAEVNASDPDNEAEEAEDADLDQEDDNEGADGASHRPPAPKPKASPKLPDEPTPDQLVAHQLALIQAIDKPVLTPRDIVHAIDYHNLAFPNRYYADKADAFQKNLEHNPILDIQGATLTAAPATIHNTTPPTATIRVTIERPATPLPPSSIHNPQSKMQNSSCLFHLIHESMFFPDPKSPHAWHTQAITTDTS